MSKCTQSRSRNTRDVSLTMGKENVALLINFMFEEIPKEHARFIGTKGLKNYATAAKQPENNSQALYRSDCNGREYESRKITRSNLNGPKSVTKKYRLPQQLQTKARKQSEKSTIHTQQNSSRTSAQPLTISAKQLTKQHDILRNSNTKPHYTKPKFLYEEYPLRPALIYGRGAASLIWLNEVPDVTENTLPAITAEFPRCPRVSVGPKLKPTKIPIYYTTKSRLKCEGEEVSYRENLDLLKTAKATERFNSSSRVGGRLKSGQDKSKADEARKNTDADIPKAPFQIKNANENVKVNVKRRNAILLTRDSQRDNLENVTKKKPLLGNKKHTKEEVIKKVLPANESAVRREILKQQVAAQPSANKQEVQCGDEARASPHSSTQLTPSSDSQAPLDDNTSLPIFERLTATDAKSYAKQPALKHKDSLLFYEDLKTNRKRKGEKCEHRIKEVRDPTGLVRFFDEVHIGCKPSDEDILFGSAATENAKTQNQSWEKSRIDWLAELERRQEVSRRRKKRLKCQQTQSKQSCLEKCCCLCKRLRSWWGKWFH